MVVLEYYTSKKRCAAKLFSFADWDL